MLAVILAGGEKKEFSPQGKAFVRILGKTMLDYVQNALEETAEIDEVIVISEHESMIGNIEEGLRKAHDPNEYLLFTTCDIPFLTTEAVADFLSRCGSGADLYYPVVDKRDQENKYPGMRRTFVKLKEGTFTGGNLILVRPRVLFPLLRRVERILELRKSPLALATELGFNFVIGVLLSKLAGTLTIHKLERRVEELFCLKAEAVISPFPEIANDIDKPADVEMASKFLMG